MKSIYLDNAATTLIIPEVIEVMQNSMQNNFGNPSSIHQFGRRAKVAVETARKNIAKQFNVTASEIFFTSGGTEADNLILCNSVLNLGVKRIITSRLEHYAVLNTVAYLQKEYNINVEFVKVDDLGNVLLNDLDFILGCSNKKTLVSLMYINNEIGNLLPIQEVAEICKKHKTYFHSDTVQAIGNYKIDLQKIPIDFIVASAHKFHGPKGVGFVFLRKGISVRPMFYGGNQEKGARPSTENVNSILGMEMALKIAYSNLKENENYIEKLKIYFIKELKKHFIGVGFNGNSGNIKKSSYKILNVRFPLIKENMLLFNLDLEGIAVSGGSACQSGSNKGSHVLSAFLNKDAADKTSIRFSFSKLTTIDELYFTLNKLKKITKALNKPI